ncbi:hypothetical protein [Nocardiopsis salina]|uniref:hypothetical protein n=1 Tax=Nocardiopsis salina TaxID=245836 RepID=UPI000344EC58|nr:hypothetical protein [Nocardiopsis salina]
MLHPPAAPQCGGVLLSVIVSTQIPPTTTFEVGTLGPDWHLIIVRHGVTFGELVRAYHRALPGWARWRLYTSLGVIDPAVDLVGYIRTRWWDDEWPITTDTEFRVAAAGREAGLLVPLREPDLAAA